MRANKHLLLFVVIAFYLSLVDCKNYYDILGVKKTDSISTIKKAFRNLAMKYHPDKNPDKKNAEAQFREIVEAYEVLSDPDKKKLYDQSGGSFNTNNQNFNSNQNFNQDFNYNDFFRDFDEAIKRHRQAHDEAHFKAHREHMKAHHENLKMNGFMFDFDDLFDDFGFGDFGFGNIDSGGDDVFGSSFIQEMNFNGNGQNCRTIKKKQGNMVISHTECH